MQYKFNEFDNEEEFNYLTERYGGKFTYLDDLPVGTKFHVENGFWEGKIIEIDGVKYCEIDDETKFTFGNNYAVWLTIL